MKDNDIVLPNFRAPKKAKRKRKEQDRSRALKVKLSLYGKTTRYATHKPTTRVRRGGRNRPQSASTQTFASKQNLTEAFNIFDELGELLKDL
ncbi:hypothetical protein [Thermovibrio ammonificans]|jgi:hypothetical protein